MPSPRTILADISDLGLDPNVAHTHTSKSGRLKTSAAEITPEPVVETPVEVEPVVEPTEDKEVKLVVEPADELVEDKEAEQSKEKKKGRSRKVVS